ncbi:MAG: hypothetical protein KDK34_03145 [Leptospiraceae bacterium]|nr:hypothetical protein [Leptospiraceae bacterium]
MIYLMDLVRNRHSRRRFGVRKKLLDVIQDQCLQFLMNIDELGYDYMPRIPLLLDWNLGNFSVEYLPENQVDRFRLFSRWDYDWFRIEPRLLDFYFCSRVSSSVGDRTVFSYLADPLLEERFRLFLRHYHAVCPLTETDLLFVKEAYRFFILNYVIKEGNHFFKEDIINRLKLEALEVYLPGLDRLDFRVLLSVLDEPLVNH